ncbi:MAG: DNA polymerase III subunit gamma/tau [Patescibacteria group bacterium]|nr:DNA polymerase III subunit gamma/tau [Patescibacteria group bacterium]
MAFYQKYRSKTFSDLIGQDLIRDTLIEAIKSDKFSHAYLLTGPRGTGKTSTARLLAKALNCLTLADLRKSGQEVLGEPCNTCASCLEIGSGRSIDVIEIDAASHTGVDEIRELIEKAQFAPNKSFKKIYIIDEVHMLSKSAFNALLKTLEEPPKHVVFILATTESHKLPATILSRVQRYDFRRVTKEDIVKNLKKITKEEKLEIDNGSLELIASNAEGGHRDAIVLLEKISSLGKKVEKSQVESMLGIADRKFIFQFLGAIFNTNPEEGLKIAHRLYDEGLEMAQFNKDIIEVLRRMLLFSESGKVLFEDTAENAASIKNLCQEVTSDQILKLIEIFLKSGNLLKDIAYPILPIEMAVIEACSINIQNSLSRHSEARAEESSEQSERMPRQVEVGSFANAQDDRKRGAQDDKRGGVQDAMKKSARDDSDGIEKVKKQDEIEEANQSINHESVPVIVLEMTDDVWTKAIKEIRQANTSLAALMRDAKPLEYTKGKLVLGVKFKFHKDKISAPENTKILEKIFCDLTGGECMISCRLIDPKPRENKITDNEELQKVAEEIFA